MQPQSTLSTWWWGGGGGEEAMGRWGVREAQLDVQLEGLRQPTTCAAARPVARLPCGDLSSGTGVWSGGGGTAEAGGPLVPEESRNAKLPWP